MWRTQSFPVQLWSKGQASSRMPFNASLPTRFCEYFKSLQFEYGYIKSLTLLNLAHKTLRNQRWVCEKMIIRIRPAVPRTGVSIMHWDGFGRNREQKCLHIRMKRFQDIALLVQFGRWSHYHTAMPFMSTSVISKKVTWPSEECPDEARVKPEAHVLWKECNRKPKRSSFSLSS